MREEILKDTHDRDYTKGAYIHLDFPSDKGIGKVHILGNTDMINKAIAFSYHKLANVRGLDRNKILNELKDYLERLKDIPDDFLEV